MMIQADRQVLAKNILAQLGSESDVKGHDSSVCRCYNVRWCADTLDYRSYPLLPEEQEVDFALGSEYGDALYCLVASLGLYLV